MEFEYVTNPQFSSWDKKYVTCYALVNPLSSETEIVYPEGDYDEVDVMNTNDFARFTSNIKRIVIPEGVRHIASTAFVGFDGLKEVILPSTIEWIGDMAFRRCESLESIVLPDNLEVIGHYCFAHCYALREINIPVSVKFIGGCAFLETKLRKSGFFKGTDDDMTCRDFQYELGKSYHEDDIEMCGKGFHYVTNAFAVLNYYYGTIGDGSRFFDVEPSGEILEDELDIKNCCSDIRLVREYESYAELLGCESGF